MDSVITSTPSIFQNHLLIPKNEQPLLRFSDTDYGATAIIFFLYILYVWLYVSNRKRLRQIVKGFYINRYANQLAREEVTIGNRVSVFLAALFVLTLTLFLIQLNEYYGFTNYNNYTLFIITTVGIILAYSVKFIVVKFLAFVFKMTKEANEYRMSIFLFVNVLGLFMFPVVVCFAFVKNASPLLFIYTGMAIIGLFLFIRLVRGTIIGLNSLRVSKFYLFLYLCTLEILPFVIAVKLFILNNK